MKKLTGTIFLLLTITILSVGATNPLNEVETSRIINNCIERLSHPTALAEANNLPTLNIRPQLIVADTIPVKKQDRRKIIKTENGQAIEITMEDGQVSDLKINGEKIPADEFEQHEDLLKNIVLEFDNIPTPPAPPQMVTDVPAPAPPIPGAPPAPPTPPAAVERTRISSTNNDRMATIYEDDEIQTIGADEEAIFRDTENTMEEHHKKMEKQRKDMEEHHENLKNQREEMKEKHKKRMEEHRVKMEEHRVRMETHRKDMKTQRAERKEINKDIDASNQIIAENIGRADNKINAAVEDQLLADGLIDSKENYSFELTGKKLKVNGKNQSDEMHQKYKQLYGELSGTPLTEKSKLKVVKRKN